MDTAKTCVKCHCSYDCGILFSLLILHGGFRIEQYESINIESLIEDIDYLVMNIYEGQDGSDDENEAQLLDYAAFIMNHKTLGLKLLNEYCLQDAQIILNENFV